VLFRCPICQGEIHAEPLRAPTACPSCSTRLAAEDGLLDFVAAAPGGRSNGERAYYDRYYADQPGWAGLDLNLRSLGPRWHGPHAPPERRAAWRRLGELRNKTVLLLGNGDSYPELYLLTSRPAILIYSDLSPAGLRSIRDGFDVDGYRDRLLFAAIDACDLPLYDESVDVIWAFAVAHHMPDLDRFLAEAARVLRPGGRCVLMDNAYSPLWQRLKLGALRPLMRLSHRREPRSPEDLRDTLAGGFREEDLTQRIAAVGGTPWFERQALLSYMWHRASVALFPDELRFLSRHRSVERAFIVVDTHLARLGLVRKNLVRLIWGFDKPQPEHGIDEVPPGRR
jgi:SAM-dependent methyltransferase